VPRLHERTGAVALELLGQGIEVDAGLREAREHSMPRRKASAAARYCSDEKSSVTFTGTPEKIASQCSSSPKIDLVTT
jgi:hypothetical protein